jgi:hypothetical protein
MAKEIPISQNPQRYTQLEGEWRIQAAPSVPQLTISKGVFPISLRPVLAVDGIIVKAGEWYMVSQATLDTLQASGNPHYAIETNGPILVKGREVPIGKTIRMIEISIDKLKEIGEELDIKNRKAGVSSVEYIYEGPTAEGEIPRNLIDQVNYTLLQGVQRPMDKWEIAGLDLGDESVYSIQALNSSTRQADGSLDKTKLNTFLTNIGNRLSILQTDFNMIKDVFYNGTFPESKVDIPFQRVASTISEEDEFPQVFKYTQTATVVETPATAPLPGSPAAQPPAPPTEAAGGDTPTAPPPGEPAQPPLPPVIRLKMRKKRDLRANKIPVYESDPSVGNRGAQKKIIKEGDTFLGYFFKDWEHGSKIWAVYDVDKTTLIGYGVADRNDFVDPI